MMPMAPDTKLKWFRVYLIAKNQKLRPLEYRYAEILNTPSSYILMMPSLISLAYICSLTVSHHYPTFLNTQGDRENAESWSLFFLKTYILGAIYPS